MYKIIRTGAIMLLLVFLFHQNVQAANDTEGLRRRIDGLETELLEVKKQLAEDKWKNQVEKIVDSLEIHGFLDTSFSFNANTPEAAGNISLRAFDVESNSFMLNLAQISIEKPVFTESPLGFRVDIAYGDDAEVFGSSGLGTTDDEFDLWQAYAQYQFPFITSWCYQADIKVGKFATLLGAEVIESKDNFNFSRSFLFGYAIPFNHTGVRLHVKPFENYDMDVTIGLVNGWDVVSDNNKGKTLEAQVSFSPMEDLTCYMSLVTGPERSDSNKDLRTVLDFILSYDVNDKLTLMLNYDIGFEANATGPNDDAQWDGLAGYAKYQILDWWAMAGRVEYFHDRDGIRTGVRSGQSIDDVNLWEFTVTSEFLVYDNFTLRLEYRHDGADQDVYSNDKSFESSQDTFSVEIITAF